MADFYQTAEFNIADRKNQKMCFYEPQLRVFLHVLASQICRLDDEPQYGYLMLSGMPNNDDAEWIVKASMHEGDFCIDGVHGETLAKQSISAAAHFPDIDLHYTNMVSSGEQLWSNAYFDEDLSVLVLAASHGQLLLSLQLSLTESGEEYTKEHFLKAYAAATMILQCMMPKDEILQSSCVTALSEIMQQYRNCMCCDELFGDLNWIKGMFARGRQDDVHQWKLWQEEHPEINTYFRDK